LIDDRATFDSIVTDFNPLARGLDMTEMERLIRNAIVCKSLEERVRQRCLEKSKNLALETAIDICRMFAATKDGMQVISGEDLRVEVDNLVAWRNGSTQWPKKPGKPKTPKQSNEKPRKCDKCGYNAHKPQEKCPARNESCKKCKKVGHFAQVCRSRKSNVNLLDEMDYPEDSIEEESHMHLLHVASLKMNDIKDKQNACGSDEWWKVLQVDNDTLHCQLDTGAYARVINTMQLKQLAPNAMIKQTKKTLVSYGQHRITPMGYVTLSVRLNDRRLNVNFYVKDSKQKPILSGKVCEALNLVQ